MVVVALFLHVVYTMCARVDGMLSARERAHVIASEGMMVLSSSFRTDDDRSMKPKFVCGLSKPKDAGFRAQQHE